MKRRLEYGQNGRLIRKEKMKAQVAASPAVNFFHLLRPLPQKLSKHSPFVRRRFSESRISIHSVAFAFRRALTRVHE